MAYFYSPQKLLIGLILIGQALFGNSAVVFARQAADKPFIALGSIADAPAGFLAMCSRDPSLCDQALSAPKLSGSVVPEIDRAMNPLLQMQASSIGSTAAITTANFDRTLALGALVKWPTSDPVVKFASGTLLPSAESAAWSAQILSAKFTARLSALPLHEQADQSASADYAAAWVKALGREATANLEALETNTSEEAGSSIVADISASALKRFNRNINLHVVQREDIDTYGIEELWRPSGAGRGAVGDCEDIALEKQIEMTRLGLPAGAARLAVVYHRVLGLHVVLLVRTTRGDFVLDSVTAAVRRYSETPYQWLRVQDSSSRRVWHRVA